MFNFNLKQTAIYQALKWEKVFNARMLKPLRTLCLIGFFGCLALFVFLFLKFYGRGIEVLSSICSFLPAISIAPVFFRISAGLALVFWSVAVLCGLLARFFETTLKKPRPSLSIKEALENPELHNLAQFLGFEAAKAVRKTTGWAGRAHCEVGSVPFFYFLLLGNPRINFIFSRALLSIKSVKARLEGYLQGVTPQPEREQELFSANFQATVMDALRRAQRDGRPLVGLGDMLVALAGQDAVFRKILLENNLKVDDIENLAWWQEKFEKKQEEARRFWDERNLAKVGTLAKEWAAGFTVTLDEYSKDLTDLVRKTLPEVVGHQKEIGQVETALSRTDMNSILLVGEPGSGRRSIVYAVALKSFLGESTASVNYKRVVELDMASLLARLVGSEKVEAILDEIFREIVAAGNIILVIDEFHNFIGVKAQPGMVDISGILGPYLHLPQFQLVAVTTYEGLHKNLEQNVSLINLLEKVEVSEITKAETLMLLENFAFALERKHKKLISQPALREIISAGDKYFPNLTFPKKAMDILDEVVAYVAASTRDKIVVPEHVSAVVAEKTEIPVGDLAKKEKEVLLNLEAFVHQRIVNQEEAVKELCSALRRARADISVRKGPMGGFLFLGPTGVGKTETAKALAEIYFGSEARMIRLDMSEFQAIKDIPRLLGSVGQEGILTTPVRERPFALVLLDEFEKAHPNILNLFLQILDEGYITDGQGRKVSFQNTIIIATSNAGYQVVLKALKDKADWSSVKQKLLDELFAKAIFRPELVNRFDAVVAFKPLTMENLLDVASLLLQKLAKNLKEKSIDFPITDGLKAKIVELGYSPVFGAREMRRALQDKVENALAEAILANKLKRGDRVEIDPETFQLHISSQ